MSCQPITLCTLRSASYLTPSVICCWQLGWLDWRQSWSRPWEAPLWTSWTWKRKIGADMWGYSKWAKRMEDVPEICCSLLIRSAKHHRDSVTVMMGGKALRTDRPTDSPSFYWFGKWLFKFSFQFSQAGDFFSTQSNPIIQESRIWSLLKGHIKHDYYSWLTRLWKQSNCL